MALERILLVKCMKHHLRIAMRETSPLYLSKVIARLLNCFFGKKHHRMYLEEFSADEME